MPFHLGKDQGKVEYWLNRAAREGEDAKTQYRLALMYLTGKTLVPNPGLASHLLARAATQGYDDAVEKAGSWQQKAEQRAK